MKIKLFKNLRYKQILILY